MAQVQLALVNDRVRPSGAIVLECLETALDLHGFRRGFDQQHLAAVVAEDQMSVGVEHRRRTSRWGTHLPCDLSGAELDASGVSAVWPVATVDVIAHQDNSAVVILKVSRIEVVDFIGPKRIAVGRDLQQCRAHIVGDRREYVVSSDHRSGDIGHGAGNAIVSPEEPARGSLDTDHAAAEHLDVLPHAADLCDDRRRVACPVGPSLANIGHRAFPDDVAGVFVQGDHGGFGTAGRADQTVTVDKGRLAELPHRHELAVEIVDETLAPANRSGLGV